MTGAYTNKTSLSTDVELQHDTGRLKLMWVGTGQGVKWLPSPTVYTCVLYYANEELC